MEWEKVKISINKVEKDAIAPLVISASRATDLPAFFAKEFMSNLRQGYCTWQNPFNARQVQYISFEKCQCFVFWSKNPGPLVPYLPEIQKCGHEFYFQYTINGYNKTLEPGVPPLEKRVEIFQQISEKYGKERVIWRFDPIILGGGLTVENTLERLERLAEQLAPYTEKLVFSFVDWYRKTARALEPLGYYAPSPEEMQELAEGLVKINRELPKPLKLATCAETIDLHALGIEHNRCVDPELLCKLCPNCEEFKKWLGKKENEKKRKETVQLSLLGSQTTEPQTTLIQIKSVKDSGQRSGCACAPSKDIGAYNTCRHRCAYCYAGFAKGE